MLDRTSVQSRVGPRYRLDAEVGEGAFGVVFRAYDSERREEVALKLLHSTGPESVRLLKREFRAARDLSHPNLVALRDLVDDGDLCYFTMSVVDGVPLLHWLGARRARSDYNAVVANLFAQIADGLAALHLTGTVHRDLKPANVLVTPDGRPVIIDLGLSTDLTSALSRRSRLGTFTGTPGYAAPEQAQGHELTAAADMFAFGILLYEAMVGKPPFTPQAILLAHLAPNALQGPSLDVPVLGELARALTDVMPERRPSATTVAARLRGLEAPPTPTRPEACIGRETELARLDALVASRTSLVYISGPPGIGKTHLLRHYARQREAAGTVVLRGRCHPRERVRFNAFDAVVDELVRYVRRAAIRLSPGLAAPLVAMFPAFRELGLAVSPAREQGLVMQTRAFDALAELLHEIAARYPLLICIEDWQWADDDSVRLLARLRAGPWQIVATVRSETRPLPGDPFGDAPRIALEPLSPMAQDALVSELWAGAPPDLRDALVLAGGHPLTMQVIHQAYVRASATASPLPTTLPAIIVRVANELDGDARDVLNLLLVSLRPVPLEALDHAHRSGAVGGAGLDTLLAILSTLGLVRPDADDERRGPAVSVFHELIRDALAPALAEAARRSLHERLLEAHRAQPAPDPAAVIHHALGAERCGEALQLALEGARAATEGLAFGRAAELYGIVIELSQADSETRHEAMLARAEALVQDGQCIAAANAMVAALEQAPRGLAPAERLRLQARATEYFLRGGAREAGLGLARATLQAAKLPWRRGVKSLIASLLMGRMWLAARRRLCTPPTRTGPVPHVLDVLWSVSLGLSFYDSLRAFEIGVQHARRAERAGDPLHLARSYGTEATLVAMAQGPRAMERVLRLQSLAVGHATRASDRGVLAHLEFMAASQAYVLGQFATAVERAERGTLYCDEVGTSTQWERAGLAFIAASALGRLGRFDTQGELVARAMRQAKRVDDRYEQMMLALGPAALHALARGDVEGALARADEARATGGVSGFLDYLHAFIAVRAKMMMGDAVGARDLARSSWRKVRQGGLGSATLVHLEMLELLARSELSFIRVEPGALAQAREHTRALSRVPHPMARAQSYLLAGLVARAQHNEARAHEAMTNAQQAFEALGQVHEASVSRVLAIGSEPHLIDTELTRLGLAAPARWRRYIDPGAADWS